VLFDVREAWFIPPSMPVDLVLPTDGTTGIGAVLRPTATLMDDSQLERKKISKKGKKGSVRSKRLAASGGSGAGVTEVTAAHAAAVAKIMAGDEEDEDEEEHEIGGLDEPLTPAQIAANEARRRAVAAAAGTDGIAIALTSGGTKSGASSLSSSPTTSGANALTMMDAPASTTGSPAHTGSPPSPAAASATTTALTASPSGLLARDGSGSGTGLVSSSSSLGAPTTIGGSSGGGRVGSLPPSPTSIARRLAQEEKWKSDIASAHALAQQSAQQAAAALAQANAAKEQTALTEEALNKALAKAKKSKQVLSVMKNEVAKLTRYISIHIHPSIHPFVTTCVDNDML
jgi:hypothetical protein